MDAFFAPECEAYLRYLDFPGAGAPCVFLHGWLGSSTGWYAHVAARPPLAGGRILLVDLFGHGYSDQPLDFGYTVEDHASTLASFLDSAGLRECRLIGHHLGGCVAVAAASMRPDLISALVLFHVPLEGQWRLGQRVVQQTEDEWVASGCGEFLELLGAHEDPAIFARVLGTAQLVAPVALYRSAVSLAGTPTPTWREQLSSLAIPRTFIVGPEEAMTERTSELAGEGCEICVVPDITDRPNFENPRGLAAAIAEALPDEG